MIVPKIETGRLVMRPYTPGDMDTVYRLVIDEDVRKYLSRQPAPPRDEIIASQPAQMEYWNEHGFGRFGVVEKESRELIGYCGLKYLEDTNEVEVYYGFFSPYWGKGIATEAANAVLKFGFEKAGLERIVGVAHVENIGSQRVLEKIGLRREKEAVFYGNPAVYFALLRSEYLAANGNGR